MATHARLKNKFTEDEKYHNLMSWLINNGKKVQVRSQFIAWQYP